ncbi:3-phosphoshikimate 1-carboxyvinyltransferase [candidate division KSB1 bacterium]|nr:3-phosphoshikimate 1-carboxyvinyltransferase [candidate division KSB1 bacterium]
MQITRATGLHGVLTMPGDKSISHRSVMLGALGNGITEITGLSFCDDVQSTAHCMEKLGVAITTGPDITIINGKGLHGLRAPDGRLDAGNSGTTIRLLSGILAGQDFDSEINGDVSLQKRPMKRIIEPLQKMNARIYAQKGNFTPLIIKGRPLHGFKHELTIASAQIKSCLLLAGLFAKGATTVTEPAQSRDHTERMLKHFGVNIIKEGLTVEIESCPHMISAPIEVPGDISSAAFFMIAASIVPNSELTLLNVGTNPTRTGIIDVLNQMGGTVVIEHERIKNEESRSDLIAKSSALHGIEIGGEMIPRIIDEIPIIAVAATQAHGTTIIRGASELRVKESDRIRNVVDNLRSMGAEVDEQEDGMIIHGPQQLKGAEIETHGDHRIAMAFAIAGLVADGTTTIRNAGCANVSHPGFFEQLLNISGK